MIAPNRSPYTQDQLQVWLRGLLTVAWADGDSGRPDYQHHPGGSDSLPGFFYFEPVTAAELREVLGEDTQLVHIPPMCKINPLYEQLVGLRFQALSYLANECGEDVTPLL
ncbi:MAG: Mo-dependent nitrogenase C-terminal domain-containing protein [Nodosilinea sp.]|jgi:hypothetical protein